MSIFEFEFEFVLVPIYVAFKMARLGDCDGGDCDDDERCMAIHNPWRWYSTVEDLDGARWNTRLKDKGQGSLMSLLLLQ